MSRVRSDPAQGVLPARKAIGSVRAVPQKDGAAIIRGAGRDVAKKYDETHSSKKKPGPNEQDWRRG